MAQLSLDTETALAKLRARSFATTTSTSQVARAIIDNTLRLEPQQTWPDDSRDKL